MNTWQFHLSNCQGLGPVSTFFVSFVYTVLLVWAFPQLHRLDLYCLILPCYLHFAFCLFVWLIKLKCASHPFHHQDCFRGSYAKLKDWKGEPWSPGVLGRPELVGGPNLKVGNSDLSSYHARANSSFHCHTGGPGKLIMFLTLTAFKI